MTKEIITKKEELPATIEELKEFVLIGNERLKTYRLKVSIIDRLKLAQDVRDQAVEDGQRMAEAVLWAEAKLGQLLKDIDKSESRLRGSTKGTTVKPTLPEGVTKKQSHEAQQLSKNPDVIKEVIADAKTEKEIPTKEKVLKKIKQKKGGAKKEKIKEEDIISDSCLKAFNLLEKEIEKAIADKFTKTNRQAIRVRLEILMNIIK